MPMPGEDAYWGIDSVGDGAGGQQIWTSSDVPGLAENTGNHVSEIWEAADGSGDIWFTYDGGNPFQIPGGGVTREPPVVVPFGLAGFAAFHTGTDHHIYMATSDTGLPGHWSGWSSIGGGTTPFGPSVAQINGAGSRELYLVYRSDDADQTIRARYFGGSIWSPSEWLGGTTSHPPAVTWNPASRRIYVVHTGTDGHVYINNSFYGSDPDPNSWRSIGGILEGRPTIAAVSNGNMLVGGVARHSTWYQQLMSSGTPVGNFHQDSSHQFALGTVAVIALANHFHAYLINRINAGAPPLGVLFKTVWNGNRGG